jgi:hypothetical protein
MEDLVSIMLLATIMCRIITTIIITVITADGESLLRHLEPPPSCAISLLLLPLLSLPHLRL